MFMSPLSILLPLTSFFTTVPLLLSCVATSFLPFILPTWQEEAMSGETDFVFLSFLKKELILTQNLTE